MTGSEETHLGRIAVWRRTSSSSSSSSSSSGTSGSRSGSGQHEVPEIQHRDADGHGGNRLQQRQLYTS